MEQRLTLIATNTTPEIICHHSQELIIFISSISLPLWFPQHATLRIRVEKKDRSFLKIGSLIKHKAEKNIRNNKKSESTIQKLYLICFYNTILF